MQSRCSQPLAPAVCTAETYCQEVRLVLAPPLLVDFPVLQTPWAMGVTLLQGLRPAQTPSTLCSRALQQQDSHPAQATACIALRLVLVTSH